MITGELKGKTVFVTGGTSGIGAEIAKSFAKVGANVHIFGTNAANGNAVLDELRALGPNQTFGLSLLNVADTAAVEKELTDLFVRYPVVDVLVNNAGTTRDNLLMRMTEEEWDQVIDVNLKSVFNFCKVMVRPMIKQRSGKIINISSVVGLIGNPGQTNYAASKAGMIGFTQSLAREVASRGICVNCIAPGFIETKMTGALTAEQQEGAKLKIPMQKMGDPSDIAKAALYLATAHYVTGQVLTVDGGLAM